MAKKYLVVGAGMGGLATALRLAHLGHEVTVLEKTSEVGGRNKTVRLNGCRYDSGPTLLMMLAPFRRLFSDVGEELEAHLKIELLTPSYRTFFRDGTQIDGTTDRAVMEERIAGLAGQRDRDGFRRLMRDLEAMYKEAIPGFVERNFYSAGDFLTPTSLRAVLRHRMVANFSARIARYVQDPRLRTLFSFQTMYLGLSPFEAPWVYAVLTYMEYGEGIWYPQGGLAEIARAIARLAEQRGAKIRLDTEVCRIADNRVLLASGEELTADTIVVNADLPYSEQALLGAKPSRKKLLHSCSAYAVYVDYNGSLPRLLHHNVFFGRDFRENLEQIFTKKELPSDTAFYAALSVRTDPEAASPGHENLFILVPCPNLDRPWQQGDGDKLRALAFDRLSSEVGFDPKCVAAVQEYGPVDYANDLNLDKGAAFGLSHHFSQSAFFRPANRSRSNPDVYYVGASTVPGNGLPMVLISAELLLDRLRKEQRLGP